MVWPEALIVGFFALIGTVIGHITTYLARKRETDANIVKHEQEQQNEFKRINENMQRMEKKLDEHNGYAIKFGEIQKDIAVMKNDIKYLRSK